MLIDIDPNDPRPVYRQIADEVERCVATGILKPDDPLPAVRKIAVDLKVNANTVQHADPNPRASRRGARQAWARDVRRAAAEGLVREGSPDERRPSDRGTDAARGIPSWAAGERPDRSPARDCARTRAVLILGQGAGAKPTREMRTVLADPGSAFVRSTTNRSDTAVVAAGCRPI